MTEKPQQQRAFLLLLVAVTVAFAWILIPFYGAVFWAVILAIVFQPMSRALIRRLAPHRTLAALLCVIICLFIAIIPLFAIGGAMVAEVSRVVQSLQSRQIDIAGVQAALHSVLPSWAEAEINQLGGLEALRLRLTSAMVAVSQYVAGQALTVGQGTARLFVSAGIMLYVLFFLFRDGPSIARALRDAAPFSDDTTDRLVSKFTAVVRATVKGNIIIAFVQGGIGGITFWILGIDGAFLWGVVMVLLSLLPAIGTALVWIPTAIALGLSGSTAKAVILVAVGFGVIGLIDNLLRPKLVGKDTRLPDYVVLVSTLGGISVFGLNGFVIGPLIAALFLSCWTLYGDDRRGRPHRPIAEPMDP